MGAIGTVTIAGVGLIGGSFALALRRAGYRGRILGVSSPATLERALAVDAIDRGMALDEAVPQSDLVYLAQPVPRIVDQLERVRSLVPDHALVTDAGSTKRAIVERARGLFDGQAAFLGGHPLAGKEGRGPDLADAALFEGAIYVLAPTGPQLPGSPVARDFRGWLDRIGCRPRVMDAAEHDRIVAWTSHLPQLVSTALASAICARLADDGDLEVSGDGLRDMTRLAASPHEVWAGILATNRDAIDEALGGLIGELESVRAAVRSGAAREPFGRGNALKERLRPK